MRTEKWIRATAAASCCTPHPPGRSRRSTSSTTFIEHRRRSTCSTPSASRRCCSTCFVPIAGWSSSTRPRSGRNRTGPSPPPSRYVTWVTLDLVLAEKERGEVGRADVYLQPGAADPVLADETVLALARRHIPGAGVVSNVDETGGEARVYLIDDDAVVEVQRPHRLRPRRRLAKGASLPEALRARLGTRVPRLFGYGSVDTAVGLVEYLCLSRMPGRAVRNAAVAGSARSAVLGELARLLSVLHAAQVAVRTVPLDRDW